jgi:hypothetical protein
MELIILCKLSIPSKLFRITCLVDGTFKASDNKPTPNATIKTVGYIHGLLPVIDNSS